MRLDGWSGVGGMQVLKDGLKVEYSSRVFAKRRGDVVVLNRHLKSYPNLHDSILMHELSHTSGGYGLKDVKLEFQDLGLLDAGLIRFFVDHPRVFFLALSPFSRGGGEWFYDPFLLSVWFVLLLVVSGFVWLLHTILM